MIYEQNTNARKNHTIIKMTFQKKKEREREREGGKEKLCTTLIYWFFRK